VCYGTQYCLRLPKGTLAAARRAGAETSTTWSFGGTTNIQKEFGRDWIFGFWSRKEGAWLQAAYEKLNVSNPPRRVIANATWLTRTVLALGRSIYDDRAFDRLPILADALEDAGCTNQVMLEHCREGGEHGRGCWVVDLLLGIE
jgi:hypothetical protein